MRIRCAWADRGAGAGWVSLILLLIFASPALASEPKFPPLTGRVVDDAGVLSSSTQSDLTDMLAAHERATGEQVVVVTLKSLQGYPIEDYGYQLGLAYLASGRKARTCALIVVPDEHKGSHRSGLRPRRNAHRRGEQRDNPKLHPAKLQARRLQRRSHRRHHGDTQRWVVIRSAPHRYRIRPQIRRRRHRESL